jgi:hypothetical protein
MHAHLLHGRQSRRRWGLVATFVLLAFGTSVLNLPIHLVHHLNEVDPQCQFLALSVSLSSSLLDEGWSPTFDHHWDELITPPSLLYVVLHRHSPQARAPPALVSSTSKSK